MGRKVYVTSDMSSDEKLIEVAEQSSEAALLWPWFLTALDDWGRAEASPKKLKARVFPMFPSATIEIIDDSLRMYHSAGLIKLYMVQGKQYMAISNMVTWYKWQTHIRTSKREKDDSRIPPPPADNTRESAQVREGERDFIPSPSPSPSPSKDIIILSPDENQFIEVLKGVENYPEDRVKDLDMYHRLKSRYPELNLIESIKDWAEYKIDQPLKPKDNPRSQINTSFKNYRAWGRNLKKNNVPLPCTAREPTDDELAMKKLQKEMEDDGYFNNAAGLGG